MIFECEKAWDNVCGHSPDDYVGSFECLGKKYDLYCYKGPDGHHRCCLQTGNYEGSYISVGRIQQLMCLADRMPEYLDALQLLVSRGTIQWIRNQERPNEANQTHDEKSEKNIRSVC